MCEDILLTLRWPSYEPLKRLKVDILLTLHNAYVFVCMCTMHNGNIAKLVPELILQCYYTKIHGKFTAQNKCKNTFCSVEKIGFNVTF